MILPCIKLFVYLEITLFYPIDMKKLSYLFVVLFSINSFAQQEASKWYFGRNAALDFSSGTPIPITGSKLDTNEGCSSFADSSGNLLFYVGAPNTGATNLTVWNKNNLEMPNGTGLKGDSSSSQSALTVPAPGNPNIYYLFTVGAGNNPSFDYYTIDMSTNGGDGEVTSGPFDLSEGRAFQWAEKITAVKADECNEFWVISFVEDTFYAYKVTNTGVSPTPVRSPLNAAVDRRGYLKVSPDGTKLVSANMPSGTFLYDFDDVNGVVSNPQQLNLGGNNGYGVEFSLSSEKLYISTGNFRDGSQENLYQFDMTLPTIGDINNSRVTIHTYDNGRAALQMAPNGKIYRASRDQPTISVINNPEESGVACDYSHNSVSLGGATSSDGLPPFISSLLLPLEITRAGDTVPLNNQTNNFCSGSDITFSSAPITGSPNYVWTFDNGTSVVELSNGTSSDLTLINLSNTDNGDYKLTATLIDICGTLTKFNGEFTIQVFDAPTSTTPLPIQLCDDDNDGLMDFNLTDREAVIISGQDTTIFEVVYFTDAGRTNQIPRNTTPIVGNDVTDYTNNPALTVNGIQPIYAQVRNINSINCVANVEFNVEVYESAFPSTTVSLLGECDNTSVGTDADGLILFDLTGDRATEILNGQDPADFTLTYFTDAAYTMQIPVANETAFQNTVVNGQTIYVRMTNNLNTNCFTDTSFEIEVYKLPVLLTNSITLIQCNDDLTLIEAFNLRLKEDKISANFAVETFTYYETPAQADDGIAGTEIANPTTYSNDALFLPLGLDTVWVRVETTDGCHRVAQVNLDVNPSSAVMNGFVTREFSQCDDGTDNRDGIATFDFSSVTIDIQTLFAPLLVDVLYYETEAQANQGLVANQLDATNYDNTSQDQLIWVQIVSDFGSDCLAKGQHVQLHVEELPIFDLLTDDIVCENILPHLISVENPDANNYMYEWLNSNGISIGTDQTLTITDATDISITGVDYSVTVTNPTTLCSRTKFVNLKKSSIAVVTDADIITVEFNSPTNSIEIITTNLGFGDYEFALQHDTDSRPWQDEPIFTDLQGGAYTVLINDKNGCGEIAKVIFLLDYPKFLTPNNDGYNDYWQLIGLDTTTFTISPIQIFDRFGKIIAIINPTQGQGWDGLYNNEMLPSSDYWFVLSLTNNLGETSIKKGHFSLIRR